MADTPLEKAKIGYYFKSGANNAKLNLLKFDYIFVRNFARVIFRRQDCDS